jgi:hypothetical protein
VRLTGAAADEREDDRRADHFFFGAEAILRLSAASSSSTVDAGRDAVPDGLPCDGRGALDEAPDVPARRLRSLRASSIDGRGRSRGDGSARGVLDDV